MWLFYVGPNFPRYIFFQFDGCFCAQSGRYRDEKTCFLGAMEFCISDKLKLLERNFSMPQFLIRTNLPFHVHIKKRSNYLPFFFLKIIWQEFSNYRQGESSYLQLFNELPQQSIKFVFRGKKLTQGNRISVMEKKHWCDPQNFGHEIIRTSNKK